MRNFYLPKHVLLFFLLCLSIQVVAQSARVTGRVTASDDGTGIPGVSILEKGTTNGTVSDSNGDYSLSVGENAVIVFSFVGYTTQEISAAGKTTIDVSLVTDVTSLSEVVVIGYGEIQKKDATGALANISTKDFNRGVLSSPQELLVGKVAGVSINTNSGAPGAASTIRIRGGSSLSAVNDPLIVVDGFPVDGNGAPGISNALAAINPNDIETFTVLKDASATAIYGSRASNGVIIITTKRGKTGKPQFSYNANVSVSSPVKFMDVLNGDEFRALVTELAEDGISGLNQSAVDKLGDANTDWQEEIYRDAVSHDHNVSAAGTISAVNLPYRISYGYTDQQGVLKTTEFNRHSLNVSLTPSFLDDNLKLTLNAKASRSESNFGETGAIGNAITFDPTRPVHNNDDEYGGYFSWLSFGASEYANATDNPVAQLNQTSNIGTADRLIGNVQLDYRLPFFKDVKLTVNAGLDHTSSDGHNRAGMDAAFTKNNNGVIQGRNNIYSGKRESELLDIYATYNKQTNDHKVEATAGYGWQHFYRENYTYNRNFEGTIRSDSSTNKREFFLLSFFGRVNYGFKGKYLFTATVRADGSSRFDNPWGVFPAAAIAWKIKDESFLAGAKSLSDLKLRVGYGVTGQQDINDVTLPYLPIYTQSTSTAQYQLGDQYYVTLRPNAYDASIKWESTTTYNVGLDFGFFEDRLTGSLEVYKRETEDLLNNIQIASGTNFSNYLFTNIGNLENKGIEFTLKAIPVEREDLTWTIGFNASRNVNKITKLLLVDDPNYPGVYTGNIGVSSNIQNHQVGYPAYSFLVYQQVYDETGMPIEGLYVDRVGDGGSTLNENNKYRYKKPAANVLMGINTQLNYKKFDFSFSGRLSLGNYVFNNNLASRAFYTNIYRLNFFSNLPQAINDTQFLNNQRYSDYYVQDASFFKMDNMSLGYSFDKVFTDKVKARLSLTVQNAFVITEYDGIDPEVFDGTDKFGIDNNIYPRPRTFLLGLNVNF
jgi:TonB-dependent starch-binding outer membrane protein SusC